MPVTATGLDLLYTSSMVSYRHIEGIINVRTKPRCVNTVPGDGWVLYLRLGEHVQTPGAHPAVCRHSDQVVGVLGAHHVHTVYWVLRACTHTQKETHRHASALKKTFSVSHNPNCNMIIAIATQMLYLLNAFPLLICHFVQ